MLVKKTLKNSCKMITSVWCKFHQHLAGKVMKKAMGRMKVKEQETVMMLVIL